MFNINVGFFRALAATGFQHRAMRRHDGFVVYRLSDGSGHVGLNAPTWEALGQEFQGRARPVVRRTVWMLVSIVPAIPLFCLSLGQILPATLSALVVLAALALGPIAIFSWQILSIGHIAAGLKARLAALPRIAAPPVLPPQPPRWLEIAGLLLIGPGLVLAVIGQIGGPDTFRNTPLTGAHLDILAIAGLAVLAALLCYRWRARRAARPEVEEPGAPMGRKVDVVARAHGKQV